MSAATAAPPQAVSPEQLRGELDGFLAAAARGETFDIVRDGQLLARLGPAPGPTPEPAPGPHAAEWPDFMSRLRQIYGDRVTPDSQPIIDYMRQDAGSPERGTDTSIFPFPDGLPPKPDARP